MPNVCPKCLKNDQVQKVISLFPDNSSPINIEAFNRNILNETRLVEKLRVEKLIPPHPPKKPANMIIHILTFSLYGGLLGYFGPLILIGVLTMGMGETAGFFCSGIGGIIGIPLGIIIAFNSYEKYVNIYEKQVEVWEKWGNLCYCSRDDLFFSLKTGESESPDNLNEL